MNKASKTCSQPGCDRKYYGKGFCKLHYNVSQKEKDPNKWREQNRKAAAKYRQKPNRVKVLRKYNAKRKRLLKLSTPNWLTQEQRDYMQFLKDNLPKGYVIDHIVALSSPIACGLNIPANLWVIPKKVNVIKYNKLLSHEELMDLLLKFAKGQL